ncbi:hypothetical protein N9I05_05605, partial [Pseudomonadales bacterium]|nr:hypothetical protein [Pseudomonadales bacterium]
MTFNFGVLGAAKITPVALLEPVRASHRLGFRNPIIIGGALIQVFALALLIVLPEVGHSTFPLLLAAIVLYFVGPNIGAPLWAGLMG